MTTGKDEREAIEQIRQIRRDIERVENEQDGTLLGKHLAEDVVMSLPGGPHTTGDTAAVEYQLNILEDLEDIEVEFSIEEITIIGGIAVERGSFELTMTLPDDDEPQHDAGEYLYTYERGSDGTWKIQQMGWGTAHRYRA